MTRPQRYTPAEERAPITVAQAGCTRCRDMLVASLGGLVRAGALRYSSGPGCELEDLLQSGYAGLLKAIDDYDPDRGSEPGAFFYHRIRGACRATATTASGPGPKAKFNRPCRSLNTPLSDDSDPELIDVLPSPDPSPEVNVGTRQDVQRVRAAVADLPEQQRHVIEARFLTDDVAGLVELGAAAGVSHETIRNLESRALRQLRQALAA